MDQRPVWKKDDEVSDCMNCSLKFSVTKRRVSIISPFSKIHFL